MSDFRHQLVSLNQRIEVHFQHGRHENALALAIKARDLAQQNLGADDPVFAACLHNLARQYLSLGRYAEAEPLYRQSLDVQRRSRGEDHPDFLTALLSLAALYQMMGGYADAEPLYQQILAIQRRTGVGGQPLFGQILNNLGALYLVTGRHAEAEAHLLQSLQVLRQSLGADHPEGARCLNNLGDLYDEMGRYGKAEEYYLQALRIRQSLGENHPDFATTLSNLAVVYDHLGRFDEAERRYLQAQEVLRRYPGEGHPDFALSLRSLAASYVLAGRYAEAEPPLLRALEVFRRSLGEDSPEVARCLTNLAGVYAARGGYPEAEHLHGQALAVLRRSPGDDHPDVATALNNLAGLLMFVGRYAEAEPLLDEALDVRRRVLGQGHPDVAESLNNLALLSAYAGRYADAEDRLEKALEIRRRALPEGHPYLAQSLHNLGRLYAAMGRYADAEDRLEKALEIRRRSLGENHPEVAVSLSALAALSAARGRADKALELMQQAQAIEDRMIGQAFAVSSDRQRLAFSNQVRTGLAVFLSLIFGHLADAAAAVQAALTVVLRRKALTAEALAAQRDAVLGGRYPRLRGPLAQLTRLRRDVALKTFAGPEPGQSLLEHQQLLGRWNAECEGLEQDLARRIPELDLQQRLRAADRQAVARALPDGSTLIEYVRFDVHDFRAVPAQGEPVWKPAHYLAFVLLAGEPDRAQMFDLGEAETIDRMVAGFRAFLSTPPDKRTRPEGSAGTPVEPEGVELRRAVFDGPAKALEGRTRLLLALDGELTQLPFETLPADDKGTRRLIDLYPISYLVTGRDALRFGGATTGRPTDPLVVADPEYDLVQRGDAEPGRGMSPASPNTTVAPAPSAPGEPGGHRSRGLRDGLRPFQELPETHEEGEQIAALLGGRLWVRRGALKGRFKDPKECRSPRILHLATHGFFLEDPQDSPASVGSSPLDPESNLEEPGREHPLLHSGLALAGANGRILGFRPPPQAEDGLLTALDVTGLDLLATDLVVLSACDTARGTVHTGEGVFGLQRAFAQAGAKTLVMSLWKVNDRATKRLMVDFYRHLAKGVPRAEALRQAHCSMKAGKYQDPHYWGAFVCQGEPSPIQGLRPSWVRRFWRWLTQAGR